MIIFKKVYLDGAEWERIDGIIADKNFSPENDFMFIPQIKKQLYLEVIDEPDFKTAEELLKEKENYISKADAIQIINLKYNEWVMCAGMSVSQLKENLINSIAKYSLN